MDPIENPLTFAMLGLVAAVAGQWVYALAKRDLRTLRDSHDWLDDPELRRMAAQADYRRISETYLPGGWILVGGLPKALGIALAHTTLVIGLRESWWMLLMVPFVYAGAERIMGAALRQWTGSQIKRRANARSSEPVGPPTR